MYFMVKHGLNLHNDMRNTRGGIMMAIIQQYDGQGVNCGHSTASEGFLVFNTHLKSLSCPYNTLLCIH